MIAVQNSFEIGHTVSKVSPKSYAVKAKDLPVATMAFVHVKEVKYGDKRELKCLHDECKKRFGRTKQVFHTQI